MPRGKKLPLKCIDYIHVSFSVCQKQLFNIRNVTHINVELGIQSFIWYVHPQIFTVQDIPNCVQVPVYIIGSHIFHSDYLCH